MRIFIFTFFYFLIIYANAQSYDFSNNITANDGLHTNYVECIDVKSKIWVGTSLGVQSFEPVVDITLPFPASITSWIVQTYNTSNSQGIPSDNIKEIYITRDSSWVWIGTDFGAALFNGSSWTTYNTSNGLISNQVRSISEDPNGGIWIGTMQGLSYFDGSSWMSYTSPDIHWSGVSCVEFDSNGDAWIGSPLGGITYFDGINFTPYDTSSGLLSMNVTSLKIDDQDNKWIGTGGGISILNPSNLTFTQHTQIYIMPPPDTLNPIVEIQPAILSSEMWAAIYVGYLAQGGVSHWDGSQWQDYDVSDGIIGQNIKDIQVRSWGPAQYSECVFVATTSGISVGFETNTLSFSSHEFSQNVSIYPNPTSSKIKISVYSYDANVTIFNNIGQIVYNANFKNELNLNLSRLDPGLYNFVVKYDENNTETHRVLLR